jgi:hypothetical protein
VSLPADDSASAAGGEGGEPRPGFTGRLARLAELRNVTPATRGIAFAIAVALFVALAAISFTSLPSRAHLEWVPGLVLLATAPVIAVVNAAEFRVMGAINGHVVEWSPAFRLAVMSGVANLLPLPGGVLIRTQALHRRGSSYRQALMANVAAGLVWIGTAALATGVLLLVHGTTPAAAAILLVVGAGCIAAVGVLLARRHGSGSVRLLVSLLVIEAATVAVSAIRIYLAFAAIGLGVSAVQSVALTTAQIVAAAVGFFPSGLGLRELLAGAIGSAVDLHASSAIAATVADRIFDQIGLSLLAVAVMAAGARRQNGVRPSVTEREPSSG